MAKTAYETIFRAKDTGDATYTVVSRVRQARLQHSRGTVDISKMGVDFRRRLLSVGRWTVLIEANYEPSDAGQSIIEDGWTDRNDIDVQWDLGNPEEWDESTAEDESYVVGDDVTTAVGDETDDGIKLINLLFGLNEEVGDDVRYYGRVSVNGKARKGAVDGSVTVAYKLDGNGALTAV